MGVMKTDCKHPITGRRCRLHLDTRSGLWYTEDGIGIKEENIQHADDGKGIAGFVLSLVLATLIGCAVYQLLR